MATYNDAGTDFDEFDEDRHGDVQRPAGRAPAAPEPVVPIVPIVPVAPVAPVAPIAPVVPGPGAPVGLAVPTTVAELPEELPLWTRLLYSKPTREPTTELAYELLKASKSTPDTDGIRRLMKETEEERWKDLVLTPVSTPNDRFEYGLQKKLENAMACMIDLADTGDDYVAQKHLCNAFALVKSAFEDLREERRRGLVGPHKEALKRPREENQLLDAEEEEKLMKARKAAAATRGRVRGRFRAFSATHRFAPAQQAVQAPQPRTFVPSPVYRGRGTAIQRGFRGFGRRAGRRGA